jgi:fluoride exporter
MTIILLVGSGGFLGAAARYLLGGWVQRLLNNSSFPYGTLAVNVLGCLLIGILAGLAESRGVLTSQSRAFLLIGVLGGFTTFSSFAYETVSLVNGGQFFHALVNVGLQVILGLAATWSGFSLMQKV